MVLILLETSTMSHTDGACNASDAEMTVDGEMAREGYSVGGKALFIGPIMRLKGTANKETVSKTESERKEPRIQSTQRANSKSQPTPLCE